MDPARAGYFWLAGQGGFGIMTSAAAARATAGLIANGDLPREIRNHGIEAADLSAERPGLERGH